jgi:small, acid-soluble spore protein I
MNIDIRNALINNLHGSTINDLKTTIESGINSKEETILPGLGVLFELYYHSLNQQEKNSFLNQLLQLF